MRLTCPNCGAQYEVPDEVIPFDGRDVQCSNCGDTWFQGHPDNPDTAVDTPDDAPVPETEAVAPTAPPEPAPKPEPKPEPEPEDDPEPEPSQPETTEAPDVQEPQVIETKPDIDAGISSILREEAEREVNLRTAESGSLESQADLGLDDVGDASGQREQATRSRMARLRGEKPATVVETRRELLPDIEEINSAWDTPTGSKSQSNEIAPAHAHTDTQKQRSGFVRGFAIVVAIGAVMLVVYAKAPMITDILPMAEPALNAYVGMIDQGRIWLDARIGAMVPTPGN